ncbi:unnamed protein product [Prunus brigantina]
MFGRAYIFLDPKVDDFENVFEPLCSVRRVGVLGLNEATVKTPYGEGSMPVQSDDMWCLTVNTRSISGDLLFVFFLLLQVQVQASGFDMEYWKLQNLDLFISWGRLP